MATRPRGELVYSVTALLLPEEVLALAASLLPRLRQSCLALENGERLPQALDLLGAALHALLIGLRLGHATLLHLFVVVQDGVELGLGGLDGLPILGQGVVKSLVLLSLVL